MDSYSIEAILTARDAGFKQGFREASKSASSLGSTIKSGLGFGVLAGIGSKAVDTITKGLSSIAAHTDDAIKRVDTLNNFPKIMKNLGYSTKDAQKSIQKMSDGIDGLPTALDSIAGATQKIAPLTGSLSKATDVTLALNDALLAGGKSTELQANALEQFSQMLSVGKVDMVAWKSMVSAMPGQMDQLAKSLLGAKAKNMDLYEAMKSGTITFEDFNNALLKLDKNGLKGFASFEEQAKDATKGIGTSMKNINTAITKGLANTIQSVDGMLNRLGLPKINEMLDKVKGGINSTFSTINGYIDGIDTAKFSELAGHFKEIAIQAVAVSGAFQVASIGMSAFNIGSTLVGKSITGIKTGMTFLPVALTKVQTGFLKFGISAQKAFSLLAPQKLKNLISFLPKIDFSKLLPKNLFSSIKTVLPQFGSAFSLVFQGIKKDMAALLGSMGKFGNVIGSVFGKLGGVVGTAIGKIGTSIGAIGKFLGPALNIIGAVVGQIATGIMKYGELLGKAFLFMSKIALKAIFPAALIGAALAGLGLLYQNFGTQIDQMLETAKTKGPEIITNLGNGITQQLPSLIASGAELLTGLIDTITANLPALISTGTQIISSLVSGVAAAAPGIMSAAVNCIGTFAVGIAGAVPQLLASGFELLASLSQGIAQNLPVLIGYAGQAITTFIDGLSQNLPSILNSAVQIVQNLITGISNSIPQLINVGIQIITSLGQAIIANLPQILQAGVQILVSLAVGITQATPQIITAMKQGLVELVNVIKSTDWISVGLNCAKAIGSGILQGLGPVGKQIAKFLHIDTKWNDSGKKGGTDTMKGATAGVNSGGAAFKTSLGNIGKYGATNLTTNLKSGTSNIPSIAKQTSTGYSNSLKSGFTTSTNFTKTTTTKNATTLKSGINPAKSAGKQTGTGFSTGFKTGAAKAPTYAKQAVSKVASGVRSGYSAAYSAGHHIGAGVAAGLRSAAGSVEAAANRIVAAANRAAQAKAKIHSPSRLTRDEVGKPLAQGIAVGIEKSSNDVNSAMVSSLESGIEAGQKAMEIHSPSKKSKKKIGKPVGDGIVSGIKVSSGSIKQGLKNMLNNCISSVGSLANTGKSSISNYMEQFLTSTSSMGGGYSKIGETISKNIKNDITNKETKALKDYKKTIQAESKKAYGVDKIEKQIEKQKSKITKLQGKKQTKDTKKQIKKLKSANEKLKKQEAKQTEKATKAYEKAYEKYEKYMQEESTKLQEASDEVIKTITESYQEKYDAIITKRNSFYSKLSDYGQLYSITKTTASKLSEIGNLFSQDDYGYTKLKDFKLATKDIENFTSNIQKLKKSLPDGFIAEIMQMDTGQGLAYTNKLLKMSDDELKQYGRDYQVFIDTAKKAEELSTIRKVELKDFQAENQQITQLSSNVERLKAVLPDGLMEDIINMDTASALEYTNELLKMSTTSLAEYGNQYSAFIANASGIADKYYKPQLDQVKSAFDTAITNELSNLSAKMEQLGQSAMQNFLKGLQEGSADLNKAAQNIGKQTQAGTAKGTKKSTKKSTKASKKAAKKNTKATKKKLKIKSPSKVYQEIGKYTGLGYIKGINQMSRKSQRAAENLVSVPSVYNPDFNTDINRNKVPAFNSEYSYGFENNSEIVVITTLDGKEVARTIVDPMSDELKKKETRENRRRGIA